MIIKILLVRYIAWENPFASTGIQTHDLLPRVTFLTEICIFPIDHLPLKGSDWPLRDKNLVIWPIVCKFKRVRRCAVAFACHYVATLKNMLNSIFQFLFRSRNKFVYFSFLFFDRSFVRFVGVVWNQICRKMVDSCGPNIGLIILRAVAPDAWGRGDDLPTTILATQRFADPTICQPDS